MHEGRLHNGVISPSGNGPVMYWMHREHRASDNWGLIHALNTAQNGKPDTPVAVVYCLAHSFLGATIRQFGFLLKGLQEVEAALNEQGIPFILLRGNPGREVARYAQAVSASLVVTDFDPLRIKQQWIQEFQDAGNTPLQIVDSRNIVPCHMASDKREYAARTIRPKIHRLLPEYLDEFYRPAYTPPAWPQDIAPVNWTSVRDSLTVDHTVPEVTWTKAGEQAARKTLGHFLQTGLARYENSNDPNADAVSHLSPFLHFGMISAQRVVHEVQKTKVPHDAKAAFLEQLVVRRELTDNYCLHTPDYDTTNPFPDWAQKTLAAHTDDPREYEYSLEQFESADTHDELWNAAQTEMVKTGYMHGYMRMYWCKKILEWTRTPDEAMSIAIHLNDRYQLDGRDPNGYVGIAWSIGGIHDQAWKERPVFGKIRYMNYAGAKRKFDVQQYILRNMGGERQGTLPL